MPNYTDYEFRSKVLKLDSETSIISFCNLASRVDFCRCFGLPMPENYNPAYFDLTVTYYKSFYPSEWLECEKILKSDRERVRRLRYKIDYLLHNFSCTFVTFTFTDNFFSKTSAKTRRTLITRFLRSLDTPFIGNIDFGDLHGREHYHAIIGRRLTKSELFYYISLNYGALFAEPIRATVGSTYRLSKYITKLVRHCVKETAKRNTLIYSRKYILPSSKSSPSIYNNTNNNILVNTPLPEHRNTTRKAYKINTKKHTNPLFIAHCTQCKTLIVDRVENKSFYTVTTTTKQSCFCPSCIRQLKIKTDKDFDDMQTLLGGSEK